MSELNEKPSVRSRFITAYNTLVNALSFNPALRKTWRALVSEIRHPEHGEETPPSHPNGFIKMFRKRRLTIAESYLTIATYLDSDKYRERLHALTLITEQAFHSKALAMPLNTARVQIALMKEAVKYRDDRRRQMELLRDFSVSSFGQPLAIRRYLTELNLVEVPETGKQLKDLGMGFDTHVHDNASYGRKTPSQLIIDAFIKGISEITIGYNSVSHPEIIEEALEAGAIMGITVHIGIEYSVRTDGKRFHYMFLLPPLRNASGFKAFMKKYGASIRVFLDGLEEIRKRRMRSIERLIAHFNKTFRAEINEGYPEGSMYALPPLSVNDIQALVPMDHATRMHLGELLYHKLTPVLFRRRELRLAQRRLAAAEESRGEIPVWESQKAEERYQEAVRACQSILPEQLRLTYFSNPALSEYATVFNDLPRLSAQLRQTGGLVKILHPLEHGFSAAMRMLVRYASSIDSVEVYNMYDRENREIAEIMQFAKCIRLMNAGDAEGLRALAADGVAVSDKDIDACVRHCRARPIIPRCGSDSTGRSTVIPGMGFIFENRIPARQRSAFIKAHATLPPPVARLIAENRGMPPDTAVVSMGKTFAEVHKHEDENTVHAIPPKRAWRYLNPALKNIIFAAAGFIPAYFFIGPVFACVWFVITGGRNAIVDSISSRGYSPKAWNIKSINFDNLAQSLFFTGFSVPLLSFVKLQFDHLWPLADSGMLYQAVKFFTLCTINGAYLFTHNMLRGFEPTTARMNFFRSVLASPLAAIFAPALDIVHIPSVVQAKFWSDFVAAFIEGSRKLMTIVDIRTRNIREVLARFTADSEMRNIALIDLMYFFYTDPRSRTALNNALIDRPHGLKALAAFFTRRAHKPSEASGQTRDMLTAWFDEPLNLVRITECILATYDRATAHTLIDLVSSAFPEMQEWLRQHRE
ncbi:MAG: hypothetical protein HZC28_16375 [Spirochaetes bacterium]|nr:hypothetical protein [Spirochaetota bacterium]